MQVKLQRENLTELTCEGMETGKGEGRQTREERKKEKGRLTQLF